MGRRHFEQALRVDRPPTALGFATTSSLPATQGQRSVYQVDATSQRKDSAILLFMSTLEEIEAAVQQLPPAKRAEFRAWFQSFDATDWAQQVKDDITTGNFDWLADEVIGNNQAGSRKLEIYCGKS